MTIVDIEDVYKSDENLKPENVRKLMDWADKQPHLPKFNELQVARFLSSCYYNMELAKVTIENNATMRTHFPEIFQNRNANDVKSALDTILCSLLPQKSPEGYDIALFRLIDFDPAKYNCREAYKKMDMLGSIWTAILPASKGQVIVIDSSGSSMGHLTKVELPIIKKYTLYLQHAMPVRLKAVHMINANFIVDKAMLLIKPFLKNDLFNLIKVHCKMESFYKYIPQECLPNEYGGAAGTFKELNDIENKRLYDYADYLKDEEKLVVDETKRVGNPKTESAIFGATGTFRKLDID